MRPSMPAPRAPPLPPASCHKGNASQCPVEGQWTQRQIGGVWLNDTKGRQGAANRDGTSKAEKWLVGGRRNGTRLCSFFWVGGLILGMIPRLQAHATIFIGIFKKGNTDKEVQTAFI